MKLSLEHITLKYEGQNGTLYIFKDMNYKFQKNELVSVLGESGCGKTSLLNIIAGYNLNYEGNIKTFCEEVEVAFMFQNLNLVSHLTVIENVMLPLLLYNIDRKEAYKKSLIALRKTGIEKEKDKKIDELSGGQRARVGLSRALVTNSKIILADEPTGSLDSVTSDNIMKLLKEVSRDHLIILVTHNESLAYKYSDEILTIENFKLKKIFESNNKPSSRENVSSKLKVRTVNIFTSFKLALSFLKGKLTKVSLAVFFSSLCFSILLMTFSLMSKGSEELISIGKDYYNYNVVEVSKKNEIKIEDSEVKLVRNSRLDEVSVTYLRNKLSSKLYCFLSLDKFISPISSFYNDGILSENKAAFKAAFSDASKIDRGHTSKRFDEIVCNESFMKSNSKNIGDTITFKNDVKVTTSFEEKNIVDLIHLNYDFKIVGVSKDKEILSHDTIYYDYEYIKREIYSIKLERAAEFLNRDFCVGERIEKYSSTYDSLLDSKSICVVDDPLKLKSVIDESKDTFKIQSEALSMTEAMKNLIDSFSKVIFIFVALALICSFFLEFVFIENIYREKTKELALYLSFHISKKSFYRLGSGQVIIFALLNLFYSYILFVIFTNLGNHLLSRYGMPYLFSLKLNFGFLISVVLIVFCFTYICGQLSLRNIYRSNLIDSLKVE